VSSCEQVGAEYAESEVELLVQAVIEATRTRAMSGAAVIRGGFMVCQWCHQFDNESQNTSRGGAQERLRSAHMGTDTSRTPQSTR